MSAFAPKNCWNNVTKSKERHTGGSRSSFRDDRNTIAFGGASVKARLSFRYGSEVVVGTSAANLIVVLEILAGATCPRQWMGWIDANG